MTNLTRHLNSNLFLPLLVVALGLTWWPLKNIPYLGEDLGKHLVENPQLKQIQTLSAALQFEHQPTRPIPSRFLATTYWLSDGDPEGQRWLSFFLHAFNCLLLFLNLTLFARRQKWGDAFPIAFFATALFAVHPLTTEVLTTATFRWELLATFFLLITLLTAQQVAEMPSKMAYLVTLLSLGGAALSKEPYLYFSAIAALLVFFVPGHRTDRRWVLAIIGGTVLWTGVLVVLFLMPTQYPYEGYSGWGVLKPTQHIWLAGRTLLETTWKFFSGQGLTSLRLLERDSLGEQWHWAWHAGLLVGGALVFLSAWTRGPWIRVWSALLGVSLYFYLAVPNINIGSEHYLYFPILCACVLLTYLCSRLLHSASVVVLLSILVLYSYGTHQRLNQMQTKKKFYLGEIHQHPEAIAVWTALGQIWADANGRDSLKQFRETASPLAPNNPHLIVIEYLYQTRSQNPALSKEIFDTILGARFSDLELANVHLLMGMLTARDQNCPQARTHFEKALALDPKNPVKQRLKNEFDQMAACQARRN